MTDNNDDLFLPALSNDCIKLKNKKCNTFLLYFGLPSSPIIMINDDNISTSTSELEADSNSGKITSSDTDDNTSNGIVYKTFFSQVIHRFSAFSDLPFEEYQSELFLDTCEEYFSIVVKFSNPIFASLKTDVFSNINRIRQKMDEDITKFDTLYGIVIDEIESRTTNARNSATNALLWLKRVFEFLACFLHEFGLGDKILVDAAIKGYNQTLRQHHGIIARNVFPLALRAVPNDADFLRLLAIDTADASEPLFKQQMFSEILEHTTIATAVLYKITLFYIEHGLE